MGWTEAQQKVIDTRHKNVLVSAAAGSGKTAVLVERIISMISEGDNPIDIDHLLVVTFTNAAAAEMRGRIGKAIDEKLLKEPDNLHLQKQMSLLQSAQITTIHSFCLNVIRNYFHRIDLDPAFKIAEDSEITLMKSDVISDILERWYEEGREDFHKFIESYSYSKSDAPIEQLILQLHGFSMSDPWPREWIDRKRTMFDITSMDEMIESAWMKELLDYVDVVLGDLLIKNEEALAICNDTGGPSAYTTALLSDRNLLEQLRKAGSYEEYAALFHGISYDRLSTKKEEGVLPWKKEKVKELREEVKKGIKDLTAQYFFQTPEEMLKDIQSVGDVMQVLFDLTLEFMVKFAGRKEEKNLIDFNDLEHFALRILINEEDHEPSQAAKELSEQFDEILIDEYQDSNMVQETILQSISREREGNPNRFMVGDVKQSIYKFRLAMPEIFMQKYETYSLQDSLPDGVKNEYQRIDLDRNFRSRKVVLDYVNKIFEQIMQKSVGGIVYDEAASLKYGELYEETMKPVLPLIDTKDTSTKMEETEKAETEKEAKVNAETENAMEDYSPERILPKEVMSRISNDVELLLVTEEESEEEGFEANIGELKNEEAGEMEGDPDEVVYTKKEIEARAIARKIREITDPEHGLLIFDQKAKVHRPATFRDIVILLRSMSNWSEVFVNTLMQEGISAYADTGTGYFQTLEIRTILNMLKIIDNPRQDIPLVGVLYSPMVGLTTTDLAIIRAANRNVSIYTTLLTYLENENDDVLKDKIQQFIDRLNSYRSMVNHKPIHELIQLVLDQTGYYYYVNAMPGGDRRKANLDMFIAQAVRFEKGSYSGLFHFIRYMEKLHKYEVDFGEAATSGEQDNTVRVMSIHKSKGLEFPVVFVAGMSKQFNTQDIRSSLVLHSELGVGPEYIDSNLRTKVPTLLKKVIQKKVQIENLGEELRVLYVAMTRAKEKLILSGYINSVEDIHTKDFSFFELLSAKSYLDWVLPAMVNCMGDISIQIVSNSSIEESEMKIALLRKKELLQEELTKQIFLQKDEQELLSILPDQVYNQELKDEIKSRLNYEYPHQKDTDIKVKMTVSELKKLGQLIDEEQSVNLYADSKDHSYTPAMHYGDEKSNREAAEDGIQVKRLEEGTTPEEEPVIEYNKIVPQFIQQKETEVTGSDRGTMYHKVLEQIDIVHVTGKEELYQELEQLTDSGKLKVSDVEKLKLDYIIKFINSTVAERMRKANIQGKLYKEKQFVIGLKASEVMKDRKSDELILIQGIIDVFFEEDGELVLLDYKSDIVKDEEQLIKRYKVQLDYYRRALEQMMKKRVKEMIIYSLPLGKEIRINE